MRRLLWLSIIAVLAGCTVMGPSPVPATKTFVVFFDSASARLTPAAQAVLSILRQRPSSPRIQRTFQSLSISRQLPGTPLTQDWPIPDLTRSKRHWSPTASDPQHTRYAES